jgi:SlyX protein
MTAPDPQLARLTELEILVTHLQRELADMHSVLLGQQKELDEVRRVLARLDNRVNTLEEPDEGRNALDERPPHY